MKAAGKGVGVAFAIMMTIAVRGGVDLDRLAARPEVLMESPEAGLRYGD